MNKEYSEGWKLMTASARAILPSRWSILWNYIIKRKSLAYTLEAWVYSPDKIGEMTLRLIWTNKEWQPQGKSY